MQESLKTTAKWAKNNSGRLLLYAVILTSCFALKFAAYGKYVDFLKDYTSVTSAPFYFTSNYLSEDGAKKYVIGTFNGEKFQLDIEVRNAENSYNFNGVGQDLYYYVTAELYTDDELTVPYDSATTYSTVIKYGPNNMYAGAMAKSVKDYYLTTEEYWDHGEKKTRVIEHKEKDINIDSASPSESATGHYNHKDRYKLLGFLPGLSVKETGGGERPDVADVKNEGKQKVSINIDFKVKPPNPIYLKVAAHTVPAAPVNNTNSRPSTMDRTTLCKIDTSEFSGYPTGFFPDNFTARDVVSDYATRTGIYAIDLSGKFTLNGQTGSDTSQITPDFSSSGTDYTLLCTLKSNSDVSARLYFNDAVMNPDDSLLPVKEDSYRGFSKYVEVKLYANGSKSCYFYKKTLDTNVEASDFFAISEAKRAADTQQQQN